MLTPLLADAPASEEFPKIQLVPFRNLPWKQFHASLFHPIARMLILIVLAVFGI
jgi:hypothetical protein